MRTEVYPLPIPDSLLADVRQLAADANLSIADVLRQATRLGIPDLRAKLCPKPRLKLFKLETALVLAKDAQEAKQFYKVNKAAEPICIEGVTGEGPARPVAS